MQNAIPSIYGKQSVSLFVQMAETVTGEYVEEVTNQILATGCMPSFEQLMDMVRSLNNDLSLKIVWLRDNYKIERGRRSTRLTRSCNGIIAKSTQDFIRTVKLIEKERSRFPQALSSVYA